MSASAWQQLNSMPSDSRAIPHVVLKALHTDPSRASLWRLAAVARGMSALVAGNAAGANAACRVLESLLGRVPADDHSPAGSDGLSADAVTRLFIAAFTMPAPTGGDAGAAAAAAVATQLAAVRASEPPAVLQRPQAAAAVALASALAQLRCGDAVGSATTALAALRSVVAPGTAGHRPSTAVTLWLVAAAGLDAVGKHAEATRALGAARALDGHVAGLKHVVAQVAAASSKGVAKGAAGAAKAVASAAKKLAKVVDGISRRNSDCAVALALRGWCWCSAGNWDKGVPALRRALVLHQGDVSLRGGAGAGAGDVRVVAATGVDAFSSVVVAWLEWATSHAESRKT